MKIFLKVKPRAKLESIQKIDKAHFKALVTALPEKGKANKAVIKLLARYFHVLQSEVNIIAGASSHNKIIEIRRS